MDSKQKHRYDRRKLYDDDIQFIQDYLLIDTEIAPADIGFIFGCKRRSACKLAARQAADLYHKGYFPYILASGYDNEAYIIHTYLVRYGVPAERILIEDVASNTQENIELSQPVIEGSFGKGAVKSAICFGQIVAARRFLMTFKRRWPDMFTMFVSVNDFGVPKQKWSLHKAFRAIVVREMNKIKPYCEHGFIKEIDVQKINDTARRINQNAHKKKARTPKHGPS